MARKPKVILTADCSGDTMRIDGHRIGPWVRYYRDLCIYVDCRFDFKKHLLPHLTPDDTAIGTPGRVVGVSLKRHDGGPCGKVYCVDAWGGSNESAETLLQHTLATRAMCEDSDITWRPTAAATAMELVRQQCFKHFYPGILPQWRELALSAIHAGPIIHATGGGYAHHIDRRKAYLHAMDRPFGVGKLVACTHNRAMACGGLTDVTVNVPYHAVPPLSVRTKDRKVFYPIGTFRGVYPTVSLQVAIEKYGVEILRAHGAVRWQYTSDCMHDVCEAITSLPKLLAKPLYTRIWGKLCSTGGWIGSLEPTSWTTTGNGLKWSYDGGTYEQSRNPLHRPDIAAQIVGINHAAVMDTAASLSGIVAMHVDSIWTSDNVVDKVKIGPNVGDWKLECTGALRYMGHGIYTHRRSDGTTKIGHCGFPTVDRPTAATIEHNMSLTGTEKPDSTYREWGTENPKISANAVSLPLAVDAPKMELYATHSPWDVTRWENGKLREEHKYQAPTLDV